MSWSNIYCLTALDVSKYLKFAAFLLQAPIRQRTVGRRPVLPEVRHLGQRGGEQS